MHPCAVGNPTCSEGLSEGNIVHGDICPSMPNSVSADNTFILSYIEVVWATLFCIHVLMSQITVAEHPRRLDTIALIVIVNNAVRNYRKDLQASDSTTRPKCAETLPSL
jgi:hypothetical protein